MLTKLICCVNAPHTFFNILSSFCQCFFWLPFPSYLFYIFPEDPYWLNRGLTEWGFGQPSLKAFDFGLTEGDISWKIRSIIFARVELTKLKMAEHKVQNILHLAFGQCLILPAYSPKKCTITALQNIHF